MSTYTDDVLSSYLDGECDPALAEEIETAMGSDPDLVARMETLGANDGLLREAFDEALGETPARLTAALEAPADETTVRSAPERSADVLAFKPRPKPQPKAANSNWPRMAAGWAVVAVMVGAIGFFSLPRGGGAPVSQGDNGLAPSHALAQALGKTPSGTRQPVGGQVLTVALSFKSQDGRLCRQFHLDGEAPADAVACRAGKGWRIEGWMTGKPEGQAGYQTAGGEDAAATAMVDRLGVASALDQAGEAAAIKAGWR